MRFECSGNIEHRRTLGPFSGNRQAKEGILEAKTA